MDCSGPSMPSKPHDAGEHRRVDEAGADRVGADAARAVVERDVLGEQHDAALRRVVGAAAGRAFETLDAGEGHDRAALAVDPRLLDHLGQRRLGHQERAGEVDGDHPLPLVSGEQVDRPATGDARGMDHAVDPTGNRGEHRGDRGFVGDVGRRRTRTGLRGPRPGRPGRCRPRCRPRPAAAARWPGRCPTRRRSRRTFANGPVIADCVHPVLLSSAATDPMRCTARAATAPASLTARCASIGAMRLPERS